MKTTFLLFLLSFLFVSVAQAQTCAEGFKLETDGQGHYQCRNPICDAGLNMYGDAVDRGVQQYTSNYDIAGMPRPLGKDASGNWVGWSIGAYQCPPDPLGLHPNPLWPFNDQYTPNSPRFLRGVLVTYRLD